MTDKTCSKCNVTKPLAEFSNSARGGTQTWCKPCSNKRSKEDYHQNKERYFKHAKTRNERMRESLRELKSVPCADCGNRYDPVAMDFDHLPEFTKSHNISYMMRHRMAWNKVLDEVAKCEVVCSNCHRIRTRDRLDVTD